MENFAFRNTYIIGKTKLKLSLFNSKTIFFFICTEMKETIVFRGKKLDLGLDYSIIYEYSLMR